MAKKPKRDDEGSIPTLAHIRGLAAVSSNIIQLKHAIDTAKERGISRTQVERCCQKGEIEEGPFLNEKSDWQVTLKRHAAGEELIVVIILHEGKLLVRSNHWAGN